MHLCSNYVASTRVVSLEEGGYLHNTRCADNEQRAVLAGVTVCPLSVDDAASASFYRNHGHGTLVPGVVQARSRAGRATSVHSGGINISSPTASRGGSDAGRRSPFTPTGLRRTLTFTPSKSRSKSRTNKSRTSTSPRTKLLALFTPAREKVSTNGLVLIFSDSISCRSEPSFLSA